MEKSQRNRIIAKEIIIVFSSIIFLGLIWLFLILRDSYYENQIEKLKKINTELSDHVSMLPTDKILWVYEETKKDFVENYKLETSKYAIPKRDEKEFLKDFPNAKHLDIYPNGYSYFKVNSVTIDSIRIKYRSEKELGEKLKIFFNKYSEVPNIELGKEMLKAYSSKKDSILVFDYIDLEKFRRCFSDSIYRHLFFATFSSKLNLKSDAEIKNIIQEGFAYSDSTKDKKKELLQEIIKYQIKIDQLTDNKLDKDSIYNYLRWIVIIIGFLLYPMRLIFVMIKWSIKIIKMPHTK